MFSAIRQAARARGAFPLSLRRSIVTTRYTKEHESVTFDDEMEVGIIGITDHAQKSLGDVVFVDLPAVGTEFSKGDSIGGVESVKAASDIYAPVSGKIVEINDELNKEPGLVNRSPDDKGWLCKIKLSNTKEFDELLTLEAYKEGYES